MTTTELNGTTFYYTEVGHAFPCVVLHGGLGVDHTMYRPTFDRLANRLRLVYFDHRCNGRSGRPPLDTLTMPQLADDAAVLARHLGIRSTIVIGHSYGGFVAQELALRHPELVAGLVLVDTTPGQLGTTESPNDEQGPPPPPELVEALSTIPATNEDLAERFKGLLPFYLHTLDPTEAEPFVANTIFDAQAMVRSMEILGGWSSVDRLDRIAAPTLVIVGRHDVATSPPQSTRIAKRIPHAELVVFDGSGHLPFLDEPERFVEVLEAWLDRAGLG
jgi:proline iminopeptidase